MDESAKAKELSLIGAMGWGCTNMGYRLEYYTC